MDLWRVSDYKTLDGQGALRASARWHRAGTRVVYLAGCPPGAMLEVLVHLNLLEEEYLPLSYQLLRVAVPDAMLIEDLDSVSRKDWTSDIEGTRAAGMEWLLAKSSAVARIPSAIMPWSFNYLLNPLHPDASSVTVIESIRTPFDERLLCGRK